MSATLTLPDSDPAHFLKIAGQGAGLASHADLWLWLQGDVQQWLRHDVLLIAWGDFRSGDLQYDIVSSLAGMRSHDWTAAAITPLISYFRDCWVAAQQLPCQLEAGGCTDLLKGTGQGTAPQALAEMRTAFVHGIADARNGTERIFIALSCDNIHPAGAAVALKLLLPFIDTALRRMAPAPVRRSDCERVEIQRHAVRIGALSERERQIMVWVAMGKTNPEIGCILDISEFTVKNHMKSIFSKLDVSNRAQAVAKLTRMTAHA